jgi:hypothetical protein
VSPIRPENRARYPKDWRQISRRIRDRAGDRCECMGECGSESHRRYGWLVGRDPLVPDKRCPNLNHHNSMFTGSVVVLTVAHLNHTPEDCRDENLKAMCQGCHLAYDADHHAETRATTLRATRAAAGQTELVVP